MNICKLVDCKYSCPADAKTQFKNVHEIQSVTKQRP